VWSLAWCAARVGASVRSATARGGASRFPPALIFGHFLLAATGLVLWIVYLATDADGLRRVAVAILLVVATLGFAMATRWRQGRQAAVAATGHTSTVLTPEQHFPVAVIGLHGLHAITTLVLVLLTALGVSD
jgi:manganese efflux pump family protein